MYPPTLWALELDENAAVIAQPHAVAAEPLPRVHSHDSRGEVWLHQALSRTSSIQRTAAYDGRHRSDRAKPVRESSRRGNFVLAASWSFSTNFLTSSSARSAHSEDAILEISDRTQPSEVLELGERTTVPKQSAFARPVLRGDVLSQVVGVRLDGEVREQQCR